MCVIVQVIPLRRWSVFYGCANDGLNLANGYRPEYRDHAHGEAGLELSHHAPIL